MCCFSQLSLLTEQLVHLIRIDPFTVLPRELALKVLQNLDATSLCRAAQVSRRWKCLADDNILWRGICEQHIGQKCRKCGWGLPILEKRRAYRVQSFSPCPPSSIQSSPSSSKRNLEKNPSLERPSKRQRLESHQSPIFPGKKISPAQSTFVPGYDTFSKPLATPSDTTSITRPWKDVYSERLTIERNWRRGRCTVRTLKGHTDGIMCLQFNEGLSHPTYPILITGSYDRTARIWNLETGKELHCLRGHTRAVRTLQFDEVKLITGSMDHTIRVWDWRKGRCIRILEGHTEGVVCLNFDSNVLASGSVDSTVKVWNLRTGGAFTLRGHCDWVNSVQLWDSNKKNSVSLATTGLPDSLPNGGGLSFSTTAPEIDPGKMLFSASDDGTIRLWDLTRRTCVRQLHGHVGQVQSVRLLASEDCDEESSADQSAPSENLHSVLPSSAQTTVAASIPATFTARAHRAERSQDSTDKNYPVVISGSLDNTIKLWDVETGKALHTFFGHIEGVWAVASDKLRLVSGSHDRTIKVRLFLSSLLSPQ
jgi:F-box/WD-40 domain protein MET30